MPSALSRLRRAFLNIWFTSFWNTSKHLRLKLVPDFDLKNRMSSFTCCFLHSLSFSSFSLAFCELESASVYLNRFDTHFVWNSHKHLFHGDHLIAHIGLRHDVTNKVCMCSNDTSGFATALFCFDLLERTVLHAFFLTPDFAFGDSSEDEIKLLLSLEILSWDIVFPLPDWSYSDRQFYCENWYAPAPRFSRSISAMANTLIIILLWLYEKQRKIVNFEKKIIALLPLCLTLSIPSTLNSIGNYSHIYADKVEAFIAAANHAGQRNHDDKLISIMI